MSKDCSNPTKLTGWFCTWLFVALEGSMASNINQALALDVSCFILTRFPFANKNVLVGGKAWGPCKKMHSYPACWSFLFVMQEKRVRNSVRKATHYVSLRLSLLACLLCEDLSALLKDVCWLGPCVQHPNAASWLWRQVWHDNPCVGQRREVSPGGKRRPWPPKHNDEDIFLHKRWGWRWWSTVTLAGSCRFCVMMMGEHFWCEDFIVFVTRKDGDKFCSRSSHDGDCAVRAKSLSRLQSMSISKS